MSETVALSCKEQAHCLWDFVLAVWGVEAALWSRWSPAAEG